MACQGEMKIIAQKAIFGQWQQQLLVQPESVKNHIQYVSILSFLLLQSI